MKKKTEISVDLLKKICVYLGRDMEPGRRDLTDDAPAAVIYDALFHEEYGEEKLEDLFPGLFVYEGGTDE